MLPSLLLGGDQTWFRCGSEKVDVGSKVPGRWLFFFNHIVGKAPATQTADVVKSVSR